MFSRVSEKITNNLVKHGAVDINEREIYLFGVHQGLIILLNIITTVAIGLLFGTLWQMLIFTVAYMSLRSYAGGYHASTPLRCYFLSTLLTTTVSLLIRYIDLHTLTYVGLLILAGIIVIAFSPVGNKNKPLDDSEKKVYKKKAVLICVIEVLTAMVLLCFRLESVAVNLVWALVAISGMMILNVGCMNRQGDLNR